MTTFVVLSPASSSSLDAFKGAMERVFPERHFEIAKGQYVAVASDLSPVQVGGDWDQKGKSDSLWSLRRMATMVGIEKISGIG